MSYTHTHTHTHTDRRVLVAHILVAFNVAPLSVQKSLVEHNFNVSYGRNTSHLESVAIISHNLSHFE